MTWDDVSTQLRALIDAVAPVEPDEIVPGGPLPLPNHARPRPSPRPRRTTLVAAAAAVIALAMGVWITFRPRADDPVPDVATEPSTPTTTTAAPATGPVALIDYPVVMEAVAGTGPLDFTDDCVFLGGPDGTLLIWPYDRTTWVPETRTIVFEDIDGGTVELHDGDMVDVGGGGAPVTGPHVEEFRWITEPAPACPTDDVWIVGGTVALRP
jgi:hypothetical protein